jgi:DDE family transposase
MNMMGEGGKSYLSWALNLTKIIGRTVSKQAIFGRMNSQWVETLKELVREVVGQQAKYKGCGDLFCNFGNLWLQDSTTLHLPDIMMSLFNGNASKGKKKSVAKLNIVVNAVNGFCPVMEWLHFTITEQALSDSILKIAKAGDMVIRDLGYFVLRVFGEMNERGIFFVSRLRYGVKLYDPITGKQTNLPKLLRNKSWLDINVLCGKAEKVPVRLVAVKLPPEQASERKRKAKLDRDKRLNHSKEYYYLLGYAIFITNVDEQTWNHTQVAEAYRLRWNIEIIFKSWKSGFGIETKIPEARTHTERIEGVLYLMLLYIAWFHMKVFAPLYKYVQTKGKQLSIIKLAAWVRPDLLKWIHGDITKKEKKAIVQYCCYEKRTDRLNVVQRLQQFNQSLA